MPDASAASTLDAPRRFPMPLRIAAVAAIILLGAACGKKGPPLPPLLNVPSAPADVTAKRSGDQVTVRFTVPRTNQSGVQPANLERIEVYAWTPPLEGAHPSPGSSGTQSAGASDGSTRGGRSGQGRSESAGGARGASRGGGARGNARPAGEVALRPEQVWKYAKLVATVPVRRPPPPPPERKEGEPPPPPPPPPTGPGVDQGTVAEVTDTLAPEDRQPLVVPTKESKPPTPVKGTTHEIKLTPPDLGPPLPPLPSRLYTVVGVNRHGRRGAMSQPSRVPLWDAPPAPTDLTATVKEAGVELAWTSPDGLRHPLLRNVAPPPVPVARPGSAPAPGFGPATPGGVPVGGGTPPTVGSAAPAAPQAVPPRPVDEEDAEVDAAAQARRDAAMNAAAQARAMAAQGGGQASSPQNPTSVAGPPTPGSPAAAGADTAIETTLPSRALFPWPATGAGFVVYEVQPPDFKADHVPPPPAVQPFPKALTPLAVRATIYSDPRVEYGLTRCYVVRTSEAVGTLIVESAASAPACVSPKDLFAPAAPRSLGAVSSEGTISLIWEAGTEADLAGYIVLRGENGGPLRPITPAPVKETTFRDATVRRGTRYTYAVVAVDAANPPNRSGESNHVEETAR